MTHHPPQSTSHSCVSFHHNHLPHGIGTSSASPFPRATPFLQCGKTCYLKMQISTYPQPEVLQSATPIALKHHRLLLRSFSLPLPSPLPASPPSAPLQLTCHAPWWAPACVALPTLECLLHFPYFLESSPHPPRLVSLFLLCFLNSILRALPLNPAFLHKLLHATSD